MCVHVCLIALMKTEPIKFKENKEKYMRYLEGENEREGGHIYIIISKQHTEQTIISLYNFLTHFKAYWHIIESLECFLRKASV